MPLQIAFNDQSGSSSRNPVRRQPSSSNAAGTSTASDLMGYLGLGPIVAASPKMSSQTGMAILFLTTEHR